MLVYRVRGNQPEVLLVHPGGPFWKNRDDGAWSLPKGEIEPGEAPLDVARREFREELGAEPPGREPIALGTVRQAGGKIVHAWAVEGDFDTSAMQSATFEIEWPPRSGRRASFPEVDRAQWFEIGAARTKLLEAQRTFLERLSAVISHA